MNATGRRQLAPIVARVVGYTLLALLACGLPIWWASLDSAWVERSYQPEYLRFELLGFTGAVALLLVAGIELRARFARRLAARDLVPALLPLLVSLYFLGYCTEYAYRSWDYYCYETAARRLMQGTDPYAGRPEYNYPPLTAQVLARAYRWVEAAPELSGRNLRRAGLPTRLERDEKAVWASVFYYYRCAQLLLVLLAYWLCYAFARRLWLPEAWAHGLAAAILVFNNPLFRTLRWNQVNLWMLDLALLGLLLVRRRPLLGGVAVALAAHVKVYPVALWAALMGARYWKAALSAGLAMAAVVGLQTDFFRDWTLWQQYWGYLPEFPLGHTIRNSSFHGIVYNLVRLAAGLDPLDYEQTIRAVAAVLMALTGLWFLQRFVTREIAYRRAVREPADAEPASRAETLRLFGHGADALAFGLLAATSVWEHHYVMAIPLALFAVATRGAARPWAVGAAAILVFAIPTFDVFPLSYHRAAGLVMLLLVTAPSALAAHGRQREASPARG